MDGWIGKKHGLLHEYKKMNGWIEKNGWLNVHKKIRWMVGWVGGGYGWLDGYNFFKDGWLDGYKTWMAECIGKLDGWLDGNSKIDDYKT